jgi:hypothetical protein
MNARPSPIRRDRPSPPSPFVAAGDEAQKIADRLAKQQPEKKP